MIILSWSKNRSKASCEGIKIEKFLSTGKLSEVCKQRVLTQISSSVMLKFPVQRILRKKVRVFFRFVAREVEKSGARRLV
jgi:hypothetical protein